MRVKHILSSIAFVAAFAFSATLVALTVGKTETAYDFIPSPTAQASRQAITKLLEQDIRNGDVRLLQVYRNSDSPLMNRARAVTTYAEDSGAMRYEHLPQDFQLAWLKHMRAWHNYADFLQKAGIERMSYVEVRQAESQYIREINATWYATLRIAEMHGAQIPDGAYSE